MKRYWLFLISEYKASGGMEDFTYDFDELEDAKNKVIQNNPEKYIWSHIFDSQDKKIYRFLNLPKIWIIDDLKTY